MKRGATRGGFLAIAAWGACVACGVAACRSNSAARPDDGGGAAGAMGATGGGGSNGLGGGGGGGSEGGGLRKWARWPMPNQPGQGLPNEQRYTVMTVLGEDVVRDEVTGLIWQRQLDRQRIDWTAALSYCDGLSLAGWDDWRLPSRIELVTLLDLTHTDPALNLQAFPDGHGEWFWSSSRQADDPTRSWYVYFYFGYPDTDAQYNTYLARCVR